MRDLAKSAFLSRLPPDRHEKVMARVHFKCTLVETGLTKDKARLMIKISYKTNALLIALVWLTFVMTAMTSPAQAQRRASFGDSQEHRPYDDKLMRLAEILGATHYLRELCSAEEGQRWRKQMDALIDAEGTSAKRRSRLVRKFNRGYRGYQRTYHSCTRPATLAITRFLKEGVTLSQSIIRTAK